jgi:hypothetical protein
VNVLTARALDTDFSVASDNERVLAGCAAVTAMYPPAAGPPTLEYVLDVRRATLFRDGVAAAEGFAAASFPPFFERDLYDRIIERAAPSLLLHAGVLVRDDRAILLVGASGAGKTTMCRALVARGAKYMTDEIAAIDAELRVRGLPRPLSLAPDSAPDDEAARALRGVAGGYRFCARDGTNTEAMLFALAPEYVRLEPAPIAAVVHLRHAPNDPAGARSIRSSEALPVLWREHLRDDEGELDLAIALLRDVPSFEVVTHSVEDGCRDIDAIWAGR